MCFPHGVPIPVTRAGALDSGICDVGQEYQVQPCSHGDRNLFQGQGQHPEADCVWSWRQSPLSWDRGHAHPEVCGQCVPISLF